MQGTATLYGTVATSVRRSIIDPHSVADIHRWANESKPLIKQLGGNLDDAFDSQVLRYLAYATSSEALPLYVNEYRERNFVHLWRGMRKVILSKAFCASNIYGALFVAARGDGFEFLPKTLVSLRVVTNNGVAAIVDAFRNVIEPEIYNFHGIGTGTNIEAVGDTALQTEITTGLNPDNTRATGTKSAPSANVYQSLGTNTVDGSFAVTEHGFLSQAATGGGVLMDRSVFSAVNLSSGNQIDTTYQLTFNAGS